MISLQQLQAPVCAEYEQFCNCYRRLTATDVPLLNDVEQYLSEHAGKQIRPLLVLLAAKAALGKVEEKHILTAVATEMLHNATLLHDDVIDESDIRRGCDSVRHRWSNQVAVLCGDYHLTRVLSLMHDIGETAISDLFNNAVSTMCEGELRQLSLVQSKPQSDSDYLDVIGAKTATLMSLCCHCGAFDFERHEFGRHAEMLSQFGYNYGMLFQIHDDINDTNAQHDIQLPQDTIPCHLLARYAAAARQSLEHLPDSQSKDSLLTLLSPHAPQPRG